MRRFSKEDRDQEERLRHLLKLLNDGPECADSHEAVRAPFLVVFRSLVNQWIDSGKDAEGVESPFKRNLRDVPPGYSRSLILVLADWFQQVKPLSWLEPDGTIGVGVGYPIAQKVDAQGCMYIDHAEYARELAVTEFQMLLELPCAPKLTRCANPACQSYYIRKRVRVNEIKRGTYCASCIGVGSLSRTKATREKRKQRLVEDAARFWVSWAQEKRRTTRSEWIAEQMNKASRPEVLVTSVWVSRNRIAIEMEIKKQDAQS